jgi:hypothetical protein
MYITVMYVYITVMYIYRFMLIFIIYPPGKRSLLYLYCTNTKRDRLINREFEYFILYFRNKLSRTYAMSNYLIICNCGRVNFWSLTGIRS